MNVVLKREDGIRGELRLNEPMAQHTSWRAGGPAARFFAPSDVEDLAQFLAGLPEEEPIFWLGLGSNLLVRDGGIPGTVILTAGLLDGIEQTGEETIRVEAGVPCPKVARFCLRLGLCGAEFLAGIPGTMGGALAMNAGAFGGDTWSLVDRVELLDRKGERRTRTATEFDVGYREVGGRQGEWFIAAHLRVVPGDAQAAEERIRQLLKRRAETQPIGEPSCGSVFRNPEGDHAAHLIETCGLKGRSVGGACVSEKHANFIINRGGATASDIETLIREVADKVKRKHGIRLKTEVKIVGQPAGRDRDS